jgi:hypothetical protein
MKKRNVLLIALIVFACLFAARFAWELGSEARRAQAWQAAPGLADLASQETSSQGGFR